MCAYTRKHGTEPELTEAMRGFSNALNISESQNIHKCFLKQTQAMFTVSQKTLGRHFVCVYFIKIFWKKKVMALQVIHQENPENFFETDAD